MSIHQLSLDMFIYITCMFKKVGSKNNVGSS